MEMGQQGTKKKLNGSQIELNIKGKGGSRILIKGQRIGISNKVDVIFFVHRTPFLFDLLRCVDGAFM